MRFSPGFTRFQRHFVLLFVCMFFSCAEESFATDYFLTIGGGYEPAGNQASLEANVVFFQQILAEKHPGARRHCVFFADGNDAAADLQVLSTTSAKSDEPVMELLATLHRRGMGRIEYRNHRVSNISGALDPAMIHSTLQSISREAGRGDRLIVYVTAHGSEGDKLSPFNTTIDCWKGKKITAREFTEWLSDFSSEVSVVMVMAQCYCGGFSHAIFNDLDESKGLAAQVRVGFFAQQHDLPAAGCRPDISNDQEFSSYFWGAIAGRSRNNAPIEGCDLDKNGVVSFGEAYAYAVAYSQTIDIPLRSSEVLLRSFSKIGDAGAIDADKRRDKRTGEETNSDGQQGTGDIQAVPQSGKQPRLASMAGTLQSIVDRSGPVSTSIVQALAKELGYSMQDRVESILTAHLDRTETRTRGRPQGRRGGSGRRSLLLEISKKWPELGDENLWQKSSLLEAHNQEQLLMEIRQLPSWKTFDERRRQREEKDEQSDRNELRDVKYRRFISALKTILLEQNLPLVAKPEVIERYRQMISVEESSLELPVTPTAARGG